MDRRTKRPGPAKKKSAAKNHEALRRLSSLVEARSTKDSVARAVAIDAWVRNWIARDLLIAEPYLSAMAHVEHRHLSPLDRTELFSRTYLAIYREMHAVHIDAVTAPQKRPVEAAFAANAVGDINALWRARATADALGVTYDAYLRCVMEGKLGNGKWTHAGQPNQLYKSVDIARARAMAESSTTRPDQPAVLSCFGYPHLNWDAPCPGCPQFRACYQHTQAVSTAIETTTGLADLRLDRKRKDAAARQRRWYAKRKKRP